MAALKRFVRGHKYFRIEVLSTFGRTIGRVSHAQPLVSAAMKGTLRLLLSIPLGATGV